MAAKGPRHIGALFLRDGLELRIIPKLEIRRVVYLLCHAAGLASSDDRLVDLDDDAPIDVALAEAFTTPLSGPCAADRGAPYFTREDDLAEVRGRSTPTDSASATASLSPLLLLTTTTGLTSPRTNSSSGAAIQLQRLPSLSGDLLRRLRRLVTSL